MRKQIRFFAALVLPLVASTVFAQSFLSRLGQTVSNAMANKTASPTAVGSSDGMHSAIGHLDWHYPSFTPDEINGYLHLRLGTASLDQFGNAVGGYPTCDDKYVGYSLLHRTELTPRDAEYCLGREQQNDPTATMATVRQRMAQIAAQIAGSRKFYTRGTVQQVYLNADPFGHALPSGKGVVQFGADGGLPIFSPSDTDFRLLGPNWFLPGSQPGFIGDEFLLQFDADPKLRMHWGTMARGSYVFYTVGEPTHKRPSSWQMGHTMYDVSIVVDKIVLQDNNYKLELNPPTDEHALHREASP